jgi:hypothetical protein
MRTRSRAALVLLLLLPSVPARAAELTAFLAVAKPDANWAGGAGGAFGINFLQVLHFEAEVAHLPGEILDQGQWTVVGSAFVAPSIGRLVPYAGLGVGGYRQTFLDTSDTGVVRNFVVGVKVKLGLVLVKGEYRKISLPDEAPIEMHDRFSVGAGVSF